MHNFNYEFILFKILLKHIRFKPIWCAHGSKVYQIKGKFTIRKETIQIQIFPMESWLPLNHHQLSWIFVLVVEEYACVVTCVPYYINCIVSENVNFKNIYISSEICSKHTDSIYRIYIYKIYYI